MIPKDSDKGFRERFHNSIGKGGPSNYSGDYDKTTTEDQGGYSRDLDSEPAAKKTYRSFEDADGENSSETND